MILFRLKCSAAHMFEGWFADNGTFDAQREAGQIACPICGDVEIGKAVMAPAVATGPSQAQTDDMIKTAKAMTMLRAAHDFVEKNFDNVGKSFANEARRIHHGEIEKRNIRGEATTTEAKELTDEGISVGQLPRLPSLDS